MFQKSETGEVEMEVHSKTWNSSVAYSYGYLATVGEERVAGLR